MLIKGHRKARLHSQSNEKLLKDSKTGGMEVVCSFWLVCGELIGGAGVTAAGTVRELKSSK